jgi:hypothetical protein
VVGGSFRAPDHDYPSQLALRLTATDGQGLQATKEIRLLPRTVSLAFRTDPSGLQLTWNGSSAATPFSRTAIVGSVNSLSATTPQKLRGNWTFVRWENGSTDPRTRTVTAPATAPATPYTATFRRK